MSSKVSEVGSLAYEEKEKGHWHSPGLFWNQGEFALKGDSKDNAAL